MTDARPSYSDISDLLNDVYNLNSPFPGASWDSSMRNSVSLVDKRRRSLVHSTEGVPKILKRQKSEPLMPEDNLPAKGFDNEMVGLDRRLSEVFIDEFKNPPLLSNQPSASMSDSSSVPPSSVESEARFSITPLLRSESIKLSFSHFTKVGSSVDFFSLKEDDGTPSVARLSNSVVREDLLLHPSSSTSDRPMLPGSSMVDPRTLSIDFFSKYSAGERPSMNDPFSDFGDSLLDFVQKAGAYNADVFNTTSNNNNNTHDNNNNEHNNRPHPTGVDPYLVSPPSAVHPHALHTTDTSSLSPRQSPSALPSHGPAPLKKGHAFVLEHQPPAWMVPQPTPPTNTAINESPSSMDVAASSSAGDKPQTVTTTKGPSTKGGNQSTAAARRRRNPKKSKARAKQEQEEKELIEAEKRSRARADSELSQTLRNLASSLAPPAAVGAVENTGCLGLGLGLKFQTRIY